MNKHWYRYFNLKYLLIIACVTAGFSFFSSCSKDSGLGSNVLPKGNILNANFKDTATIYTSLVLNDTIPTNLISTYLLGSYNDPIFGPTAASFYTQVYLPNGNPFGTLTGEKVLLDSVVLAVEYGLSPDGSTHYYGVINPQTIEVDTINKALVADSTYYSNGVVPHSTTPLGTKTLLPNFTAYDTGRYGNQVYTRNPRFTIKLDTTWGRHWLNIAEDATADSIVSSTAALQRHFPGLYITTSGASQFPAQGGLWYMNPFSGDNGSGIIFYFRTISSSNDTAYNMAYFNINSSCIGFNHFDHDYSLSPFYPGSSKKDSVYSPSLVYVQGIGGVITQITMPYLANWAKKAPLIINKAEVDIPVDANTIGIYGPPAQMYLIGKTDTSTVASTATFPLLDEYQGYYGGTYDPTNQQYVFTITQYVQSVIDGKAMNNPLYLVPGSRTVNPNRVVMHGSNNSPRLRLKIYYTPLKS